MTNKVSVIIPAYNRVKYINQTVDCVLNQTYQNIELIVVDDGSTDGTYERLAEYGDRLVLLTHEMHKNRGQSASINLGLKSAKGEFVAILDSDDFWELNKLEIQVEYFNSHPDVGLVYTNGHGTNAAGEITYDYHKKDHVELNDPNRVLLDCYLALPVNSLVRKKIYDEVGGFNESYRAAQDHDMLIRVAEVTKLAYLPDFLFYYRRHVDSISHTNLDVRWKTGFKILDAAAKRYPYRKSTIRKRRAVLNYRLWQVYKDQEKYLAALGCLILAGVLDPMRSLQVILGRDKAI